MSQHEIASRAHHYVITLICIVAMGAVLAHVQHQDEVDDQAAQQHAQGARPVGWIDLEKVADAMTIVGRRK